MKGIDVSNNQGTINWNKVKKDGVKFAICKTSEGQTFVDKFYERNRTECKRLGIIFGAYHYGRPSLAAGDATKEAQFFLSLAKPRAGDIVPALDIEVNDGLTPKSCIEWVADFVETITEEIDVDPLLYSYPFFWRARMGNTTRFRSLPLWIANYEVAKPDVPGGWDDYAIWQHTSSGHVDGVAGRCDMNIAKTLPLMSDDNDKPATIKVLSPNGTVLAGTTVPDLCAKPQRIRNWLRIHGEFRVKKI